MKKAIMLVMYKRSKGEEMHKFSKDQLYDIYGKYLEKIAEIAQIAHQNNVFIEINISPDGDIEFRSREYYTECNKECVTTQEIKQGRDYVNENIRTTVLHGLEDKK